jgi:hypothetical protein
MKVANHKKGTPMHIQWNLSNPTHHGTKEMCRIVQDVGKLRVTFFFLVNRNLHKFNKRRHCVCLIMQDGLNNWNYNIKGLNVYENTFNI